MISFYSSHYTVKQLHALKAMLLEGLYFLQDSLVECNGNTENCKHCMHSMICKDFRRTITHVEKLVETVETTKNIKL